VAAISSPTARVNLINIFFMVKIASGTNLAKFAD